MTPVINQLKPVEDLTDSEKFAIAYSAGVPIKEWMFTPSGFKAVLFPASISISGGQYVVTWRRPAK